MKTRLERNSQQTVQCIYNIPCECGRSYVGETSRPLAVRLREHKHGLKEGLVEDSKLVQHAFEEGRLG
jgi:predicted GIY-YIG superfamily endonuclease